MTRNIIFRQVLQNALCLSSKGSRRKIYNFMFNIAERLSGRTRLHSMPVGMDLISTTRCNFKCFYCKKFEWGKETDLSPERFDRVADVFFPTLVYLKLGSAGEHLLNPNLEHVLMRCKQDGVAVIMNSNGSLLDEDRMQMLLEHGVKVFGISLDGATGETAERIRKGLHFDKLVNSLKRFNEIKEQRGLAHPILTVNFAAMRSNIEELPEFIRVMARTGICLVRVMYLYVHDFMDPDESLFLHPESVRAVFPKARKAAKSVGVRLILPPDLTHSCKPKSCHFPYHEIGLSPDGSVAFCCNAWDQRKMGNIFQQDFKNEVWNSGGYQALRKTVNSQEPVFDLCRECSALDRGTNGFSRHLARKHHAWARRILESRPSSLIPLVS